MFKGVLHKLRIACREAVFGGEGIAGPIRPEIRRPDIRDLKQQPFPQRSRLIRIEDGWTRGVHAAAAALAGARAPLKASPEQKAKAAGALRRYYSQLGETPPDSLKQSAIVDDILEHHGVKGMKWGVRRKATVGPQEVIVRDSRVPGSKRLVTRGGGGHPATAEAVRIREIGQRVVKSMVQ